MLRTWLLARLLPALLVLMAAAPALARESGEPLEGYVSPPIVLPVDPKIYYYARPDFAEIEWPLIPDRFCSPAEKEAYLAQLDYLVAIANANSRLAIAHELNFRNRLRVSETLNASPGDIGRHRLELDQLRRISGYHSDVWRRWSKIRKRLTDMPVVECEPRVDLPEPAPPPSPPISSEMEGYFVDPVIATPEDVSVYYALGGRPQFARPNFPAIALAFCSQEQKDAYLAQVATAVRAAAVNANLARIHQSNISQLAESASDPQLVAALRAEYRAYLPIDRHYAAVLAKWREIEARMKALPVTDCEPPQDLAPRPADPRDGVPSPGINPFGLPALPTRFCSEEERRAFLADVYAPFAAQASAQAVEATRRLTELSDLLDIAVREYTAGPVIDQFRKEHEALSRQAPWLNERARRAIALRKAILAIPVVPCEEPAEGRALPAKPAAPPPKPRPTTPLPDSPRRFAPPNLAVIEMIDLPVRFCSESERMKFLTDVYHPAAQQASRSAVEAAQHLADLSRIIADGPNATYSERDIEAAELAHTRFAPVAAFHRERALRFLNLRAAILNIPVVNCEPVDADTPSLDETIPSPPPPPPPSPPPPPPPTALAAPGVRPSTSLEAGVIEELNLLRADPAAYADRLTGVIRGARRADVEAAIAALRAASPAPPLEADPRLSGAAIRHADDIGPPGLMSHTGTDGSTLGGRIRDQGLIASLTAEELSYGQSSARAVVVQLVIDAGVAGAPHRRDLLNPVFRRVGVGCGPHKAYRSVCVITLSGPPVGP